MNYIMKVKRFSLLISIVVLINVPACSYVRNWFPDKEKDYQYTTEIPPLVLPKDLGKTDVLDISPALSAAPSADAATNVTPAKNTQPETVSSADLSADIASKQDFVPATSDASTPDTKPAADVPLAPLEPDNTSEHKSADKRTPVTVNLLKSESGVSQLRIDTPFDRAWRIVNKALSRKSIEVTDRNQEERLIVVQYDSAEQTLEDGSMWDEVVFIFSGLPGNEKEYSLKLSEAEQQTNITVLDENRQSASDAGSLSLLKLLQETIKADFAKKEDIGEKR